MTLILEDPDEGYIKEIGKKIRDGETCIYPTETCYGLGTNALKEEAVRKIYKIKERERQKDLTCIVSSLDVAEKYCKLNDAERRLCEEFMPGPLTLVTEKGEKVPEVLNEDFVFRIPSNEVARKLTEEAEVPVVATSANFSGSENSYRVKDISRVVRERVDIILDCGELEKTEPSTVAKVGTDGLEVFRDGPVSREEIERFLSI